MRAQRFVTFGSVFLFCASVWGAVLLGLVMFWQAVGPVVFTLAVIAVLGAVAFSVLAVLVKRELQREWRWYQVRRAAKRQAVLRFRARRREMEQQREWRSSWSPSGDY